MSLIGGGVGVARKKKEADDGRMDKRQVNDLRSADLELLEEILHDDMTSPAVKIQAIQTREKILATLEEQIEPEEERPIDRIMASLEEE